MAESRITAAERARLAHRALRLVENGVDSERKVKDVRGNAGNPLSGIARSVLDHADADAPGPTDEKLVNKLMTASLDDIMSVWEESVEENLKDHDPAQVKAMKESQARDQKAFEERMAEVEATGDFPVHPRFGHMRHTAGAANALYDLGRQGFLSGLIDWDTATIKACLVDSADYVVALATHEFLSSILAAGREETSGAFTTKTVAAGVADADDITFTAAAGDPVDAIVIYQSSAVTGGADVADTAQRLIAYIDTVSPAFPLTLNGGDVTVTWDAGASRIFKL